MKKTTLLALSLISPLAFATDITPVTFYNNTDRDITVSESTFYDQLNECKGNTWNLCVQQQVPITILAHGNGTIPLVTAVKDEQIHQGRVGFTIKTDDDSFNEAIISVMATLDGAHVTGIKAGVNSYAYGTLPRYVVSVSESITPGPGIGPIQATVVSINPLEI